MAYFNLTSQLDRLFFSPCSLINDKYNMFLPILGKLLSLRYEVLQMSARMIKMAAPLALSCTYIEFSMYSSESNREAIVASGCVSSKFDALLYTIIRYRHAKHNTRAHFAYCFLFQILRKSQNIPLIIR